MSTKCHYNPWVINKRKKQFYETFDLHEYKEWYELEGSRPRYRDTSLLKKIFLRESQWKDFDEKMMEPVDLSKLHI